MKTHDCRGGDWLTKLGDALEGAEGGDKIKIDSDAALEIALSGKADICPEKDLHFEVEETSFFFGESGS